MFKLFSHEVGYDQVVTEKTRYFESLEAAQKVAEEEINYIIDFYGTDVVDIIWKENYANILIGSDENIWTIEEI